MYFIVEEGKEYVLFLRYCRIKDEDVYMIADRGYGIFEAEKPISEEVLKSRGTTVNALGELGYKNVITEKKLNID